MAEVAASIIGIASFGVNLTLTLYDFASTTAAAREQALQIAKNVTLYSNVLELLANRLEEDEPIITDAALDLAEELREQSLDIFNRIRALLPTNERNGLSMKHRLMWPFRRKKLDLLIAELEYLKSTVQLLVTVIFTGRRLQRYQTCRAKHGSKKAPTHQRAADLQCLKAQTAIIEQINAAHNLTEIETHFAWEDQLNGNTMLAPTLSISATNGTSDPTTESAEREVGTLLALRLDASIAPNHMGTMSDARGYLLTVEPREDRQAHVIQTSADILQSLLDEWTISTPLEKPEPVANEEGSDEGASSSTALILTSTDELEDDVKPQSGFMKRSLSLGSTVTPERGMERQSGELAAATEPSVRTSAVPNSPPSAKQQSTQARVSDEGTRSLQPRKGTLSPNTGEVPMDSGYVMQRLCQNTDWPTNPPLDALLNIQSARTRRRHDDLLQALSLTKAAQMEAWMPDLRKSQQWLLSSKSVDQWLRIRLESWACFTLSYSSGQTVELTAAGAFWILLDNVRVTVLPDGTECWTRAFVPLNGSIAQPGPIKVLIPESRHSEVGLYKGRSVNAWGNRFRSTSQKWVFFTKKLGDRGQMKLLLQDPSPYWSAADRILYTAPVSGTSPTTSDTDLPLGVPERQHSRYASVPTAKVSTAAISQSVPGKTSRSSSKAHIGKASDPYSFRKPMPSTHERQAVDAQAPQQTRRRSKPSSGVETKNTLTSTEQDNYTYPFDEPPVAVQNLDDPPPLPTYYPPPPAPNDRGADPHHPVHFRAHRVPSLSPGLSQYTSPPPPGGDDYYGDFSRPSNSFPPPPGGADYYDDFSTTNNSFPPPPSAADYYDDFSTSYNIFPPLPGVAPPGQFSQTSHGFPPPSDTNWSAPSPATARIVQSSSGKKKAYVGGTWGEGSR